MKEMKLSKYEVRFVELSQEEIQEDFSLGFDEESRAKIARQGGVFTLVKEGMEPFLLRELIKTFSYKDCFANKEEADKLLLDLEKDQLNFYRSYFEEKEQEQKQKEQVKKQKALLKNKKSEPKQTEIKAFAKKINKYNFYSKLEYEFPFDDRVVKITLDMCRVPNICKAL